MKIDIARSQKVSTALGQRHRILRKIIIKLEYDISIKKITLFLCPVVKQEFKLGPAFWRLYEIEPQMFPIEEISM